LFKERKRKVTRGESREREKGARKEESKRLTTQRRKEFPLPT